MTGCARARARSAWARPRSTTPNRRRTGWASSRWRGWRRSMRIRSPRSEPASFAAVAHDGAIDGLAESTASPPIGDLDPRQWRATLDQLAASPPAVPFLTGGFPSVSTLPDPAEVRAFLANNHVLVVAGTQD